VAQATVKATSEAMSNIVAGCIILISSSEIPKPEQGSPQAKAPALHPSLSVEKRTILCKRIDGSNSYTPTLDLPEPMLPLQEHNGLVP
jgi:hypothetical protein